MPDNTAENAASARTALPTLRRTLDQYANCTPAAVSGGSQAQMYYFVEDAKHDIAALAEALRKIDKLASRHETGAIGKAQQIARIAICGR
jgi:hypothetical protein